MRRQSLAVLAVLVLAVGFGVVDAKLQDTGTNQTAVWLSNMSSAYLLLAFVAGRVVARQRFAAVSALVLGLVVTAVALGSFYEWQVTHFHLAPVLARNDLHRYLRDGVFAGPLFGWLGHRWGLRRSWYAGIAVVSALVLERYAWQKHLGFTPGPDWIWSAEQLLGVGLAVFFTVQIVRKAWSTRPAVL